MPLRHRGTRLLLPSSLILLTLGARAVAQDTATTMTPPAPGGAVISLPPTQVSAPRGTSTTQGYVATRSSTGTKTNTPLIKTPQSISVVTRKQMTDQDAHSLNEALRYTSGVQTETRGADGSRYDLLTVRGFDATFYWNGLRLPSLNYIAPQIDAYLLQEVDVQKGPSSTLYGQGGAGGLVNQVSKLPTATPLHEVGMEFGNYGHAQTTFDMSGPIDRDGKYLYRVTGIGLTEAGQASNTRNERVAIAPSFTWRPDDETRLTLMALYQHDPAAGGYNDVPAQGSVLYNPYGSIPNNFYSGDLDLEDFNRTQASLGYQFEKHLSPVWTLRANGRWFHTDQNYESVYGNGLESDDITLDRGAAVSRDALDTYTFDNQAEAKFNTGPLHHTMLFGVDYQRNSGWYNSGFGIGPSLDIWSPNAYEPVTLPARTMTNAVGNQYGLYAQDQIGFGRFVLSLAGREDWANSDTSSDSASTHESDQHFSGRAGLLYLFDTGIAPYVSYAESFLPQLGADKTGKAFVPETGSQYEVGVKYQPPGTHSLFTAALFDLTRDNVIAYDASGLPSQGGQAASRGVELEAKVSLTHRMDVTAAYTYLDTAYTDTSGNGSLAGKALPSIPRNAASVFTSYKLDSGTFQGVTLGGGVRYTGFTYNSDNSFQVPDVTLVDASVRYDLSAKIPQLKGAEVALTAHNLLDRKYVASCYYGAWCGYGYGRQVYANLTYRW